MKEKEFMKHAEHACNFTREQLAKMLDWEEIEALKSGDALIERGLLLWSQFAVGNASETLDEIQKMSRKEKRRVLKTWIDITADTQELKMIALFIAEMLDEQPTTT